MPGRVEKTIFISYRRTNMPWALAIYQNLSARGYDVFFDFQSINSGDFEQIIIGNIKARAHFLVILTPSALERCNNPGDWLRREIETALEEKRNIIPLFLEGFSFGNPSIAQYLTGKLELLKNYNGLNVHADYFHEAMDRLEERFLNVPLDAVLHPVSNTLQKAVDRQQAAASQAKVHCDATSRCVQGNARGATAASRHGVRGARGAGHVGRHDLENSAALRLCCQDGQPIEISES